MKRTTLAALVASSIALTACADAGLEKPRTDTVVNACADIGNLFKEGLEYRLAGVAMNKIVALIGQDSWVDQETALQIASQVMAQNLPRDKAAIDPFLEKAEATMADACVTASALEPTVNAVVVK